MQENLGILEAEALLILFYLRFPEEAYTERLLLVTYHTELGRFFKSLLEEYTKNRLTLLDIKKSIYHQPEARSLFKKLKPLIEEYTFDEVLELQKKKSVMKYWEKIVTIIEEQGDSPLQAATYIQDIIMKIRSSYVGENTLTGYEVLDKTLAYLKDLKKDKYTMKTPFEQLNYVLGGGYPTTSGLHVIAGPTSHGKTTMAIQLAAYFLTHNPSVVVRYYSLEMPPEEIGLRLLQALFLYQLDAPVLYTGGTLAGSLKKEPHLIQMIEERARKIHPGTLERFMMPADYSYSIDKLLADLYESINNLDSSQTMVAFIDHLQILTGESKNLNVDERIGNITRRLREFSLRHNMPIFLISQMNREYQRRNKRGTDGGAPKLSDLKGSSAIEHDAVTIAFVTQNRSPETEIAENKDNTEEKRYVEASLWVLKNRWGLSSIHIPLLFDKVTSLFVK